MADFARSTNWIEEDTLDSTEDPNISVAVIAEEVPALTIATIIGMTVVMLAAIAIIFVLGVLIDWRQQRLIDKKMGEPKRHKSQRRADAHPEDDSTSIANNMEEPGISVAPAEALKTIP